tara:strand:- start:289 stop:549 length:261 start_codon:yes stop_codon:yes gene_type:complete
MNDKDIINIQKQLVELTESLEVIETLRDDIAHFWVHEEEEVQLHNRGSHTLSPLMSVVSGLHTAYEELDNAIKTLEKVIDYWGEEE